MWIAVVSITVAIGIGVAIGVSRAKKIKALQDEGKIIRRDIHYAEKGEEFTSKIGSCGALKQALETIGIPCAAEGNTATQILFSGTDFKARLYRKAFDEPSGIGVYRFEFTHWKTEGYSYANETGMNMLLTTVEKAFLSLDPNTGVSIYDLQFKTKHTLF